MMVILGMFFLMSIQPILMASGMLFIVLLYSFVAYNILGSYWFSYALVMVMLSGVLVIFIYMISLIPNESFEMYNLIMFMILLLYFIVKWFEVYGEDYSFVSINLWFSYIGMFNLFLVSFLLCMMLMVVWLSCLKEGAVRVIYKSAWMKG